MDTVQDKSAKDQCPASAGQPPPFPELTQLVMPGFEHLSRPYTLRKAPRASQSPEAAAVKEGERRAVPRSIEPAA